MLREVETVTLDPMREVETSVLAYAGTNLLVSLLVWIDTSKRVGTRVSLPICNTTMRIDLVVEVVVGMMSERIERAVVIMVATPLGVVPRGMANTPPRLERSQRAKVLVEIKSRLRASQLTRRQNLPLIISLPNLVVREENKHNIA